MLRRILHLPVSGPYGSEGYSLEMTGTLTLICHFFPPHYLQEMEEERIPEVSTREVSRLQEQVKGTRVQGQVDLEQNDTGAW